MRIKTIGHPINLEDVSFGHFNGKVLAIGVNTELENIDIEPLDILVEINGEKINHNAFTLNDLKEKAAKEINHFVLERDGKKIEIALTKKMLGF
jgi:hypothetical protein